jgi:hypothetical protein
MRRFFVFSCALCALLALTTTAAFAGNGRSGALHGKSGHGSKGKSAAAQAGKLGPAGKPTVSEQGRARGRAHKGADVKRAESRGKSAEAQHHVILCHRTGSDTNPYVVINVSVRAWEHGHTTHPEQGGRHDILLRNPAGPGEKMAESHCQSTAGSRPPRETPGQPGGVDPGGETGGGGGPTTSGNAAQVPPGRVLGAEAAAPAGSLPFTGMPVWIVFLAGVGLLTAGLVARHAARGTR